MKPIVKKVIEAGLVDQHTLKLMQRWGYIDSEESAVKVKDIKEGFTQFVEELDTLLEAEQEEEVKETRFSINLREPAKARWLFEDAYGNRSGERNVFIIFKDEADNLIFPGNVTPYVDREFEIGTEWYRVSTTVPLYFGNTLYAHQVTAEQFR